LVRNILLALLSSLVPGEGGGTENQRANKGRYGPSQDQGHQDRTAEARDRTSPENCPTGTKGETPYAIAKALGVDRRAAAKYAV